MMDYPETQETFNFNYNEKKVFYIERIEIRLLF